MSSAVVDSSGLLALLNQEPGAEELARALATGASVCAVTLSEVVAKLDDSGMPEEEIRQTLEPLDLNVVAFDGPLAYRAGLLRASTRQAGLSLGDRACLALAQRDRLPALTADRAWKDLRLDVMVKLIR